MEKSLIHRIVRESDPASIETDLTALWREAAREAPVVRAIMSNLVVFRERAAVEPFDVSAAIDDLPLDEIGRRHPSRVIILVHTRGDAQPPGQLAAGVAVLTFGSGRDRYGVEEIVLRSECTEESLASLVRRLTLGDLPTSVWWMGDLSRDSPLEALVAMGRQLVYDSRAWHDVRHGIVALAELAVRLPVLDLADLNWRRLLPMRQAILHALAPAPVGARVRLRRAQIAYQRGEEALAWLLIGWLASRLDWPRNESMPVDLEEVEADAILSLAIGEHPDGDVRAVMDHHGVVVRYRSGASPFHVTMPPEDDAEAIVTALRGLGRDVCLREALITLAQRFARNVKLGIEDSHP